MARPRKDTIDRFSKRYSVSASAVLRHIEREVIGGVFGANGYTTKAQAEQLIDALELRRSTRLLDLGSGRGWPGLYLAKRSRCRVVLADAPEEGLRIALDQASRSSVRERTDAVRGAGESLPFRKRSLDAVTHTDVL